MADALTLRKFETLSPFEIKDELIKLAKKTSRTSQSAFLNAGRGNPNWIATTPREGFFLLGQFAITESRRVMNKPAGIGGMPKADGIAKRLEDWLAEHKESPGASFLQDMVAFAVKRFDFKPDAFVHELVDSIIGSPVLAGSGAGAAVSIGAGSFTVGMASAATGSAIGTVSSP